jgi:hypothetical protein
LMELIGPSTVEAIRRNLEKAHGPRYALHRGNAVGCLQLGC